MKFRERFPGAKVGDRPAADLLLTTYIYACWANGFTHCGARTGWRDVSETESGVPCCSDECFFEMRGRPLQARVVYGTEVKVTVDGVELKPVDFVEVLEVEDVLWSAHEKVGSVRGTLAPIIAPGASPAAEEGSAAVVADAAAPVPRADGAPPPPDDASSRSEPAK